MSSSRGAPAASLSASLPKAPTSPSSPAPSPSWKPPVGRRHLTSALNLPSDAIRLQSVDVVNAEAVAGAVSEAFDWRPIDVMVCSAGVTEPDFLDNVKASHLEAIVRTNILGGVVPIQSIIPLMKTCSADHPCSIVIVGSLSACAPCTPIFEQA
ncbi:hypothetical protein L7F22_015274 [Adiantum nelumboides]|nr:hypothetical protein [Adiantum nelumboides]